MCSSYLISCCLVGKVRTFLMFRCVVSWFFIFRYFCWKNVLEVLRKLLQYLQEVYFRNTVLYIILTKQLTTKTSSGTQERELKTIEAFNSHIEVYKIPYIISKIC